LVLQTHLPSGEQQVALPRYRICVTSRSSGSAAWIEAAKLLGVSTLTACAVNRLYFVQGALSLADVQQLCMQLLADPVTEDFSIVPLDAGTPILPGPHTIEVTPLPGVTDPAAENLERAAHLIGLSGLERASTGQQVVLGGTLSAADLHKLAVELFSNPVVQRYEIDQPIEPPFFAYQHADSTVEIIAVRGADEAKLAAINAERRLALDPEEMRAVRDYFTAEGRDPTDAELEMIAQTWSEHCSHKSFRARIDYTDADGKRTEINGLLRTYIRAATETLRKPWVKSAFVDNAGIVAFSEGLNLAFKVETHNHPSALEPFGGANTGVGGVVRDILGVSAKPIANTDILCFGPPDTPEAELPGGVLPPRRIADGVIRGVEDYGNKMGIPTVNGAILYHPGYTANPLVFCGCLGTLPEGSHVTTPRAGDLIVVIGGRTGRDGLRGATFSSLEMDHTTSEIAGSSVQIGHPIHEKQVQEVVLRARDERLYTAITDCGAGGLSSAVGEMAQSVGGTVQLATVPLKYPGLRPWEIWLSEAQERMVFAIPPENWARFQAICAGQDVEAVSIGTFEATGRLKLYYGETLVGDLTNAFLHDGMPQRQLTAVWTPPAQAEQRKPAAALDHQQILLDLLAHPNIRSKEATIRLYDHEVQGGTAIKPLVGVANHGPSDATVLVPDKSIFKGVAVGAGVCPAYGEYDPYAMAFAAVDEAFRNLVAVGADPDQVALLDNFCWGNPKLADRLGSLVRATQGCYDAALAYEAPFISGKDSLNNEYTGADGRKHAIPGTLLISAIGLVPDVRQTVTMDLKAAGNVLYLVGQTRPELLGSHLAMVSDVSGAETSVPQPVPEALAVMRTLHRAIAGGLVRACHDCSEGGLAVAAAEMCIAGRLGAELRVEGEAITALYAESLCRFVVEVAPEHTAEFEALLAGVPLQRIGQVSAAPELRIVSAVGQPLIQLEITALETAWRGDVPLSAAKPAVSAPASTYEYSRAERRAHKRVLILHANGTNRDHDAALACELAGGVPEIVHVNQLLSGEKQLGEFDMLVVPGGFSYGDDLGAGTLWALDLRERLGDAVRRFVESGRPVLGICNGFQALVKAGILPGSTKTVRKATLTFNESERFECRWVYLAANPASNSLFLHNLSEPIYCPVAHGEGRFISGERLDNAQVALTYLGDGYPANPNGSPLNIAGVSNAAGNVLGLMPHPENHVFPWQHPRYHRGEGGMLGLKLFKNGIKHA